MNCKSPLYCAAAMLLVTSAMAGQSPKPFRALTGEFEGGGKRTTSGFFGPSTGELEGTAMISQPDPPSVSTVGFQSTLERTGLPDATLTWIFEFRRKGVVRLVMRFADGSTGTLNGTYSTKRSRVIYEGTMQVDNGLSGPVQGSFRLRRNKFIVRDRVVFSTQTLRSKQVFRRND